MLTQVNAVKIQLPIYAIIGYCQFYTNPKYDQIADILMVINEEVCWYELVINRVGERG